MSKLIRLAMLAAALMIAVPGAVMPIAAQAQTPLDRACRTSRSSGPHRLRRLLPAAPVAPAPAAKGIDIVDNPYGLDALWKGGDLIARITLGILVLMSMGSWYIIITKVYEQSKMGSQARAAAKHFWTASTVQKGAESLKKGSPYRFIAESGLEATTKHEGLLGNVDLNTWISMSIQRAIDNVQSRTQDGLAFLATVGFDGAVRRAVRHGVGHLPRADRHRHRRPGVDRQGRGSGGRGADHDGDRPRRRGTRGARLQLADPPQQVGDGAGARLRRRPARRAAVRAAVARQGVAIWR